MKRKRPAFDVAAFAEEVVRLRDELRPKLPDVDPGDLLLICQSLLRPFAAERDARETGSTGLRVTAMMQD